jgi:hypothetical protein
MRLIQRLRFDGFAHASPCVQLPGRTILGCLGPGKGRFQRD